MGIMELLGSYFDFLIYHLSPSVGLSLGVWKLYELWEEKKKEWKEHNEYGLDKKIFFILVYAPLSIIMLLTAIFAWLGILAGDPIIK
jgi:hypothetical protein